MPGVSEIPAHILFEDGVREVVAKAIFRTRVEKERARLYVTRSGAFTSIRQLHWYLSRIKQPPVPPFETVADVYEKGRDEIIPIDELERARIFFDTIRDLRSFVRVRGPGGSWHVCIVAEGGRGVRVCMSIRELDAMSSYCWKHIAEECVGGYVSNGAFIVAAIERGVPLAVDRSFLLQGVNVKLRMREIFPYKRLSEITAAREETLQFNSSISTMRKQQ